MTDSNKMSRRDWFRLRPRPAKSDDTATTTNQSMGEVSHGLEPIAHPVNHDGMDLSELPPMREALLSEDQLRQLFADIEALASDIMLMQKSPRSARATAAKATTAQQLQAARDALLSGAAPRIQIRYHWQAANWIDTLERRPDGVRLIRISHTTPAARVR